MAPHGSAVSLQSLSVEPTLPTMPSTTVCSDLIVLAVTERNPQEESHTTNVTLLLLFFIF